MSEPHPAPSTSLEASLPAEKVMRFDSASRQFRLAKSSRRFLSHDQIGSRGRSAEPELADY